MSCSERQAISGYLDDALSARQRASFLVHLQECPDCAQTLAHYRQMDLMLRRLPPHGPPAGVRDRLIDRLATTRRLHLWDSTRGLAAVAAVVVATFGFLAYRQLAQSPSGYEVTPTAVPPVFATNNGPEAADSSAGRVEVGYSTLLQQVRRTVQRPGFQPLMPRYLPTGTRLDNVNLSPDRPGGPINRMEVGFVATGRRLRLRQESPDTATAEQQLVMRGRYPQRVMAGGHEWLYLRGSDQDRGETTILVGARDGVVIWLESSLPLEELTKVAASLEE